MKILVSILTCSNTQNQAKACIDSWLNDVNSPHDYIFYGDKLQSETMKKTWNCSPKLGENRKRLPEKTLNMLKLALNHEWDFLYKCDDDSFVNFKLLEKYLQNFNSQDYLYIGRKKNHKGIPYAQGGAGYILSRPAIKKAWKLLNFYLNQEGGEDLGVAKAMKESDIKILDNIQLNEGLWIPFANRASDLDWNNESDDFAKKQLIDGKISSHYLSVDCMKDVYNILCSPYSIFQRQIN